MSRLKPEQKLQIQVAEFLDVALPIDSAWTAINPVPAKSKAVAGLSKAMGLKAGFLDILILYRAGAYLIELKAKRGKLSDDQHGMTAQLISAGAKCAVARSLDEVIAILNGFGIPLRARGA
jgi:hypothetical protein